jgi:predicted O-methyltransferase YrrM
VALFRRRKHEEVSWIFAEEVVSAVTQAECGRLAELASGTRVLEIGAHYGRSTIALASVAEVVHSIDPHRGGPPEAPDTLMPFLENLAAHGVRDRVLVHVGPSQAIAPFFRRGSFELAFVDAVHQRPAVDIDLTLAACCVRPGGWLALHDYGRDGVAVAEQWHPFGVTEAVEDFVALTGADPPEVVDSLAVVRVPAEEDALAAWDAGVERFGSSFAT